MPWRQWIAHVSVCEPWAISDHPGSWDQCCFPHGTGAQERCMRLERHAWGILRRDTRTFEIPTVLMPKAFRLGRADVAVEGRDILANLDLQLVGPDLDQGESGLITVAVDHVRSGLT